MNAARNMAPNRCHARARGGDCALGFPHVVLPAGPAATAVLPGWSGRLAITRPDAEGRWEHGDGKNVTLVAALAGW